MGENIRHVKLRDVEDLGRAGLKEMVTAAARLEGKPMREMGGKTKAASYSGAH